MSNAQAQWHYFQSTHAYTRRSIQGVEWAYIACGKGRETLLLLPGAPGFGDTSFQYILALEHRYRIIAPSLPSAVTTMQGVVAGLVGLLTSEGIEQFHSVGGSYGGMIAQCLVRGYPALVNKLILSHTWLPDPRCAHKHSRYAKLIQMLPPQLLRVFALVGLGSFFWAIPTERRFWWRYFQHLFARLSQADYLARLGVWIDYDRHYRFDQADLRAWQGKVLIIEADDDEYVRATERADLCSVYPQAQLHTFHRTGHAAWITRRAAYLAAMEGFLSGYDPKNT